MVQGHKLWATDVIIVHIFLLQDYVDVGNEILSPTGLVPWGQCLHLT